MSENADSAALEAAQALRAAATDQNVDLWPANYKGSTFEASSVPGEKGLTYLAKRAYEKMGYSSDQAKDACIMLSALFVEKLGADPKLGSNAVLRITPDGAELVRMVGTTMVNTQVSFAKKESVQPFSPEPAPKNTREVRLGVDLVHSPDGDLDRTVRRGLSFDRVRDISPQSFFVHFYANVAHYSQSDASVAAEALLRRFTVLSGAEPVLSQGDLLMVGPTEAILRTQNHDYVVSLSEEASATNSVEISRGVVTTQSERDRMTLQNQIKTPETLAFFTSLSNQLIAAVPNLIVTHKGPWGRNGDSCNVYVSGAYYTVVHSSNGAYRVFAQDAPQGGLGTAKTEWTNDFDVVVKALS